MQLTNLNLYSTTRITKPNVNDQNQTLDIEFDNTKNATLSNEFYKVLFYGLPNGYITGHDGGSAITGFKFIGYDNNTNIVFETPVSKFDMVVDESNDKLELICEYIKPDSTIDIYLTNIKIFYIANKNDVNDTNLVMTTNAPSNTVFAELITEGQTAKGILIEGGSDTKFKCNLSMVYKSL